MKGFVALSLWGAALASALGWQSLALFCVFAFGAIILLLDDIFSENGGPR